MLQPMFARKPLTGTFQRKASLGWQIAVIVAVKVMLLTGIWYTFVREHKVPHGTPETTHHILS